MKSYTDLEQSKKLVEILPIKSADMYYEEVCNLPKVIVGSYILHNQCMKDKDYKKLSNPVLSPAWSIAALLGVLPKGTRLLKSATDDTYHCDYPKENIDKWFDNPVDACVAMIEKLNELKML